MPTDDQILIPLVWTNKILVINLKNQEQVKIKYKFLAKFLSYIHFFVFT